MGNSNLIKLWLNKPRNFLTSWASKEAEGENEKPEVDLMTVITYICTFVSVSTQHGLADM